MSLCRAVCYHFPDRRFHQIDGKLVRKSACYLADRGHFFPRPDGDKGLGNISKGRKRLAPSMQEDQIVVATFGQSTLSANPESALLETCEPSCGLGFGEVTIPSFVILHARLGDERFSVGQCSHDIGQVMMGLVLKCVANRERRMLRARQLVGRGKLRVNIATRIVLNQWMIFKPHQKAFFELATERLPDSGACFEARNPS